MGSGRPHLRQSTPSSFHTSNTFTSTMADAEQQAVEEVAPESVAENPEEVTAVAAETASEEATDPPAEAVAAVKISEDAAAAPAEGEAAAVAAPEAVVEGEEAVASPPVAAAEGEEPPVAAAADEPVAEAAE